MPKTTYMKPVLNNGQPNSALQFKVKESIAQSKKVRSKNVFDYKGLSNKSVNKKQKVPKGSHKMPDGTIMKDKDMKKKY